MHMAVKLQSYLEQLMHASMFTVRSWDLISYSENNNNCSNWEDSKIEWVPSTSSKL